MSIESGPEPIENNQSPDPLEEYKGATELPFDVIDKGAEIVEYPYNFAKTIKANWTKVCEFMDWKKDGANIDLEYFKVAKDPFALVETIQSKIVSTGAKLPRYGVDGKFGPETKAALDAATSGVSPDIASSTEHVYYNLDTAEDLEQLREDTIGAIPKVIRRLSDADIYEIEPDMPSEIDDEELIQYQTRTMAFREDIVQEEPHMKPMVQVGQAVLEFFEEEVRSLGKIKIENIEDIREIMQGIDMDESTFVERYNLEEYEGELNRYFQGDAHPEHGIAVMFSIEFEMLNIMRNSLDISEDLMDEISSMYNANPFVLLSMLDQESTMLRSS